MKKNENPAATNSFAAKIKGLRLPKSKKTDDVNINPGAVSAFLLGMNNGIPICAEASACCWDVKLPEGYEGQSAYVSRRTKTGHTSVIEHSNCVMYLEVPTFYNDDLVEFLDNATYLETKTFISNDMKYHHLIIGGSFRAYSDLYREFDMHTNSILMAITNILYTYADYAYFVDLCEYGILDKDKFLNAEPDPSYIIGSINMEDNDLFKVINKDSIKQLYTNLYYVNKEAAQKIKMHNLIKFVTITILFKNMSRSATHQLVRHRNAITQESQRYVDYSNACFSSPAIFKPDKYDPEYKYPIRFGSSGIMHMTLDEIGEAMCNIYEILRNPANSDNNHVLLKEDARAFLPTNVQCKKIYITFTYKKFLKFLNLREDVHAQAEIRMYAQAVGNWFRENSEFTTKEICDSFTLPNNQHAHDVFEDALEVQMEIGDVPTVNDYIKALGLETKE